MSLEIDTLEDRINEILSKQPAPPIVPVIDDNGVKVGSTFLNVDFYGIVNRKEFPDIFEGFRMKVILLIGGTHVRIFQFLNETEEFARGLKTPMEIIGGPPEYDMTLEELCEPDSNSDNLSNPNPNPNPFF